MKGFMMFHLSVIGSITCDTISRLFCKEMLVSPGFLSPILKAVLKHARIRGVLHVALRKGIKTLKVSFMVSLATRLRYYFHQ